MQFIEIIYLFCRSKTGILIASLLICSLNGTAQTDLREAVYGKPKKSAKPKSVSKNNKSPQNSAQIVNKRTVKPQVTVVFTAKESLVEIFLNDKNVGVTDENLQFSKKIAPGEYRLMAKNKRQVLVSKKIIINAEQNKFELFEKPSVVANPVQTVLTAQKPKEKTPEEIAREASEKILNILNNYENPGTTDTVTPEDWQYVFQNVQAEQYQGLTAVQIEAHRWFASGQIERNKKDLTNAMTAFQKTIEYLPKWAYGYYELGNTELLNNQPLEAIKYYQKALQLNNKAGFVYKRLGDAQKSLGKEKEALISYSSAVQFGYKTFETRYSVAILQIENKQIEKGINELELLSQENPSPEIFVRLGESYEKLKRTVSAIENYQKAIAIDPNAIQAHYKIGGIFLNQREYNRAKDSLEKAIALDPQGKLFDIKEAQKKLREIATKTNK